MRLTLALISLILCLAIPVRGFAHVAVLEMPCPMESSAQVASIDAPATPHCCNDADTFAKTGKACKSGQACQTGSQMVSSLEFSEPAPVATHEQFPALSPFFPSASPPGFWRPPTQL